MRKRLLFWSVTLLLLFVGLELVARVIWWRESNGRLLALPAVYGALFLRTNEVVYDSPLVRYDPVIGYSCIPGLHHVTVKKSGLSRTFAVTIDPSGYRTTNAAGQLRTELPEIWICGCSFTWGYLVDDKDTYPALIQERMPDYWVRNFGGNGFGTIHAYLQIRDAVENGRKLPLAVILAYNPLHLRRNTLSPGTIAQFSANRDRMLWIHYPLARMTAPDQLSTLLLPVFSEEASRTTEPSDYEWVRLEHAILAEIKTYAQNHHVAVSMAVQAGDMNDPGVAAASELGLPVVDMRVPLLDSVNRGPYTYEPLDGHPNERAHEEWAARLLPALREMLAAVPRKHTWRVSIEADPRRRLETRPLEISNPRNTPAAITNIATDQAWLQARPTSLDLAPFSTGRIELRLDGTKLAPGMHRASVIMRQKSGEQTETAVEVSVNRPASRLALSSTALLFRLRAGESVERPIEVLRTAEFPGKWQARVAQPAAWLSIGGSAGSGDGAIRLRVDARGLAPGFYAGSVEVSEPDAAPVRVALQLEVLVPGTEGRESAAGADHPVDIAVAARAGSNPPPLTIPGAFGRYAKAELILASENSASSIQPVRASVRESTVALECDRLSPGIYRGDLVLSDPTGRVRSHNLLLVIR